MSWIEVVDALGRVVARRTSSAVPCTIGSAGDNTLVVEDPGVAPYHARIDRETDGRLTVTVLGGSSGLQRPGAPELALALALTPSAAVALGGSIIRLVDEPSRDVPARTPEPSASGWRALVASRPVQWATLAVVVGMGAAIGYFTLPGSERAVNTLIVAAVLLVSECAWVGAWALTGRIRHGTARFGQHFVVATVITVLGWIVGEMESWQKFLVPGATSVAVLLTALTALIWVFALLGHLQVMNRANWQKHVRIAATFGVVVFLLVLGAREYRGDWSNDVEFTSVLKAWPERLVPAKNPDQLTASLAALQDQLDHDGEATADEAVADAAAR